MTQNDLQNLDVENEKPLSINDSVNSKTHSPQEKQRDWIGLKRVTLFGVLGSLLPLTTTAILGLWGTWQTENNTMISREQDIEKDYQAQDAQNAKLVADYYEAMTRVMEKEKSLEAKKMQEVIKARTLNVFSQLSNDLAQSEDNQKSNTSPQLTAAQDSLTNGQFQIGRKPISGQKIVIDQSCSISNRARVPAWTLLVGGARDSLKQIEACAQQRQMSKNSLRKGELLKFLYEAELIGNCSSINEKDQNNKNVRRCTVSIFNLEGAKLNSAKSDVKLALPGVNLKRARLSNANLQSIDLSRANLDYAFLDSADLQGALLRDAQMTFVYLEGTILDRADLARAILKYAQLMKASLKQAILGKADLRYANLCGADLRDADLSNAILDGANLELAKYTTDTKWPTGFKPREKGLIPFNDLDSAYTEAQQKMIDARCKDIEKQV